MTNAYTIADARYCKGKFAVRCPSDTGYKSPAARLAECLGGRYTNRERAYIMSAAAVDKFLILIDSGIVGDNAILDGQPHSFSYYDEATGVHVDEMTASEAVKLAKSILIARAEAAAAIVEPVAEVEVDDRPVVEFGAIEIVDDRPIVEFGAIESHGPVEMPATPGGGFAAFLAECEAEDRARAEAAAAPVEPAPVEVAEVEVAEVEVAPADRVPVEPFQPRAEPVEPVAEAVEPTVVIDWIRASELARAARRRPAPARVADRPLVASDLF